MEDIIEQSTQEVVSGSETDSIKSNKLYLNKQNRNTLAAFKRSRTKVIHDSRKKGTLNLGKNKLKVQRRNSKV